MPSVKLLQPETPLDGGQCRRIGRLQAHLEKPDVGLRHEPGALLVDELGPDFRVNGNTPVIVRGNERADLFRAPGVQVEHRVHQVDLGDVFRQPEEDFFFDSLEVEPPVPDRVVLVVEAEAATEDGAALRFDADDSLPVVDVSRQVGRRIVIEVGHERGLARIDEMFAVPEHDPADRLQCSSRAPCFDALDHGDLSFTLDHHVDHGVPGHDPLSDGADLGPANDDPDAGTLRLDERRGSSSVSAFQM